MDSSLHRRGKEKAWHIGSPKRGDLAVAGHRRGGASVEER
jgi:hypothetical protein